MRFPVLWINGRLKIEHLVQVVKQVSDIVSSEPLQVVQAFCLNLSCDHFNRCRLQNLAKMLIDMIPKIDKISQLILLVICNGNPFVLVVNNFWSLFILRHNKPADIILCRIHQVTQNFFLAPFQRGGLEIEFFFTDRS